MKKLGLLIPMLLFVCVGLVSAQVTSSGDVALPNPFDLKLSGTHTFDYRLPAYSDDFTYDQDMKWPMFQNALGLEAKQGKLKVVSNWEINTFADPNQTGADSWSTATRARYGENYVSWDPGKFIFSFGYQIYAWGVADIRNPTDNLNPIDYTDLSGEKPHKIPVLSSNLYWFPADSLSVTAVFVPQAQNSIFPIDYQEELASEGFSNVTYKTIDGDPANFIAGGKLNYHSSAGDFSASYLYDFDSLYTPVVRLDSSENVTGIDLERKRIHRFGLDAKTTLGPYGVWAEACYSMTGNHDTSDYSERLSRIDYTVGFDFNYGPQDTYYLNLQYIGSVVPGFNYSANTNTSDMQVYYDRMLVGFLGSEMEEVTQGLTFNAQWNFADSTFSPKVTGIYTVPFFYDDSRETRYGNLVLRPEIDVMPIDSFHIVVGAILSYACVKTDGHVKLDTTVDPVGIYTPYNNVFISISYKWVYETAPQ